MSDCPMCGMNCGDTCYRPNKESAFITIDKEAELKKANAELVKLVKLIRDDLKMRADFDSEDGGAIINISGFIWDKINEVDKHEVK